MNRRGFLKLVGIFAASTQIPAIATVKESLPVALVPPYKTGTRIMRFALPGPAVAGIVPINLKTNRGTAVWGCPAKGGEIYLDWPMDEGEEVYDAWLGGIDMVSGWRGQRMSPKIPPKRDTSPL